MTSYEMLKPSVSKTEDLTQCMEIREHTRIGELARRWERGGERKEVLLRGAELREAESWSAYRPNGVPGLPDVLLAFLRASRGVENRQQVRTRRSALFLGAMLIGSLTVGFAYYNTERVQTAVQGEEFYVKYDRLRKIAASLINHPKEGAAGLTSLTAGPRSVRAIRKSSPVCANATAVLVISLADGRSSLWV